MGYGQQVSRPVMSFEEAMKGALEKSASKGDPSVIIFPYPLLVFLLLCCLCVGPKEKSLGPGQKCKKGSIFTRDSMRISLDFGSLIDSGCSDASPRRQILSFGEMMFLLVEGFLLLPGTLLSLNPSLHSRL